MSDVKQREYEGCWGGQEMFTGPVILNEAATAGDGKLTDKSTRTIFDVREDLTCVYSVKFRHHSHTQGGEG